MKSSIPIGTVLLGTAGIIYWLSQHHASASSQRPTREPAPKIATTAPTSLAPGPRLRPAAPELPADPNYDPARGETYWKMETQPFPVSQRSANFAWTSADGTDPKNMKQLANNRENYNQMATQNQWVTKRQLVYLPDNFAQTTQGIYDGSVKEFTLPGFDGEELRVKVGEVVITEPDQRTTGYFYGYLANEPKTVIYASSVGNTWSIGVDRPDHQDYRQMDTRIEGEIIVSQIDTAAQTLVAKTCSDKGGAVVHVDDVGKISSSQ